MGGLRCYSFYIVIVCQYASSMRRNEAKSYYYINLLRNDGVAFFLFGSRGAYRKVTHIMRCTRETTLCLSIFYIIAAYSYQCNIRCSLLCNYFCIEYTVLVVVKVVYVHARNSAIHYYTSSKEAALTVRILLEVGQN